VGPFAAIPSEVAALTAYIQQNSAVGRPIACTCRMGMENDPMAVTNNKLQVRGVQHLRIVDASVFPTICGGNPCVPVYMVAEKAADINKRSSSCRKKGHWSTNL